MREILFRGKRVDNGEWCYGVPLVEGWSKKTYIASYEYSSLTFIQQIEIIPETVGQFTGLTDKNGKRIFEGDIVAYNYTNERNVRSTGREKVIYDVTFGVFCPFGDNDFSIFSKEACVCGNIHDNPELLTD